MLVIAKTLVADFLLLAGSRPYDPDVQGNLTGWKLDDNDDNDYMHDERDDQ